MRILIIVLALVLTQGCSHLKTKNYQPPHQPMPPEYQAMVKARYLCNAAGLIQNTPKFSSCMVSEMQRQLDQMNYNKQARRARIGQALGVYQYNMNRAFDRQHEAYESQKRSIYTPAIQRPTNTHCMPLGDSWNCTTY